MADCWCVLLNRRAADLSPATSLHPPPSTLMNTAVCALEKAPSVPLRLGGGDKVRLRALPYHWIKKAQAPLLLGTGKSAASLVILSYPATTVCTIQNHSVVCSIRRCGKCIIEQKPPPHWGSISRQCEFVPRRFSLTNPFSPRFYTHAGQMLHKRKKKSNWKYCLPAHDWKDVSLQTSRAWSNCTYLFPGKGCFYEHGRAYYQAFKRPFRLRRSKYRLFQTISRYFSPRHALNPELYTPTQLICGFVCVISAFRQADSTQLDADSPYSSNGNDGATHS